MSLFLRHATFKEIKHSCLNYHYAKSIPAGKYFALSIFEDNDFKGVIIYSRGANPNLCKSYNIKYIEIIELTRIAMKKHITNISKIISISMNILKKENPNIKLIVSYADTEQGHRGQIYKASNFLYDGESLSTSFYDIKNKKKIHARSVISKYGSVKNALDTGNYKTVRNKPKIRYIYFLDKKYKDEYMRTLKGKK